MMPLCAASRRRPPTAGPPSCRTSYTFGYDANSGRLQTVTDDTNMAAHSYIANADLVGQIKFSAGRMVTTKQYDKINRLMSIGTVASGGATVSAGYAYNSANLRTVYPVPYR